MAKTIAIKLAHLAQKMKNLRGHAGDTVGKLLGKANIKPKGDIFVNGTRAGMNTKLKGGEVIAIAGTVQGGK